MPELIQITQETDTGCDWLEYTEFINIEWLHTYLLETAQDGEFERKGRSIWTTREALERAEQELAKHVARQLEKQRLMRN